MSVINQVLNQLEQRGANTPLERTLVRAVPQSRLKLNMPLLVVLGVALGVALAAGIVTWQGKKTHNKPEVVAMGSVQPQPAVPAPVAPPAAPAAVAGGISAGEAPLEEILPPVSRLIFESSSPPQLATPQQGTGQAASASSGQAVPVVKNEVVAEEHPAKTAVPALPAPPAPPAEEHPVKAAPPERAVRPRPTQSAPPKAQMDLRPPEGVSPMKRVSPAQQAEAEFRNAVELMQRGHVTDAMAGYEAALRLDAGHDAARQALVALLLESRRGADAGRVLQDGLKHKPEHTGFAMLLARLQVEQGTVDLAAATLETSLPYAKSQADYQAFYAALMQRQNRHKEAIAHYQVALQLAPDNGIWLMGLGISLQALERDIDAKNAFRRALETKALSPELQAFVQRKIKEL